MASSSTDLNKNLDWFSFETRIRKLISDTLIPVLDKINMYDDTHKVIFMKIENLGVSFDEMNNKIHKNMRKIEEIEELRMSFYDLSQTVRAHEVTNYEKHGASTYDIKSLKDKVKVISEDILRVESINSNLKSEINKYAQFTLEHKFYYNDKLSEMKTELLDGITHLRTWLTKLELKDTVKENVISQQRKEIEELITETELVRKTISLYLEERNKNEAKEKENEAQNSLVNSYATHHIKLLSNRITQLEVELRKTDNYIEKQVPIQYIGEIYEAIDY